MFYWLCAGYSIVKTPIFWSNCSCANSLFYAHAKNSTTSVSYCTHPENKDIVYCATLSQKSSTTEQAQTVKGKISRRLWFSYQYCIVIINSLNSPIFLSVSETFFCLHTTLYTYFVLYGIYTLHCYMFPSFHYNFVVSGIIVLSYIRPSPCVFQEAFSHGLTRKEQCCKKLHLHVNYANTNGRRYMRRVK